jgi:DNA-binding LytR/AlgR family response regulator
MEQVKILIVEDEYLTAARIQHALLDKGYIVTGHASSASDAIAMIEKDVPNLVLMDIHLNGKIEGILTAKKILNSHPDVSIIYVTEYSDDSIFQIAKETSPTNYITKPFTNEVLIRAVELAVQRWAKQLVYQFDLARSTVSDAVFVQVEEGLYTKLAFSDILYVESQGASSKIYFIDKNEEKHFLVSRSSNNLVAKLKFAALTRTHKSYFVNIQRVESIRNGEVSITGSSTPIPIGTVYKDDFIRRLTLIKHNNGQK